jgi:hypothetical protein
MGDSGISLRALVDLFSRPPGRDLSWSRYAGPFRLRDLPRTRSVRGRIG